MIFRASSTLPCAIEIDATGRVRELSIEKSIRPKNHANYLLGCLEVLNPEYNFMVRPAEVINAHNSSFSTCRDAIPQIIYMREVFDMQMHNQRAYIHFELVFTLLGTCAVAWL